MDGCDNLGLLKTALQRSDADYEDIGSKLNLFDDEMTGPAVQRIARRPAAAEMFDDLSRTEIEDLVDATTGSGFADALDSHTSGIPLDETFRLARTDGIDLSNINLSLKRYDQNDIDISSAGNFKISEVKLVRVRRYRLFETSMWTEKNSTSTMVLTSEIEMAKTLVSLTLL